MKRSKPSSPSSWPSPGDGCAPSSARPVARPDAAPGSSHDYFEAIGADWDRLRKGFFPDRVRDRAVDAARVEAGRVAADIGAGTGFLTEALLARGARVIAVDQSQKMLDALGHKFGEGGRVSCRVGDAGALPIDDASVDCCLANMFLHHVEDPAAAIAEMARVVKPGGRVVITDLDLHDHEFLRREQHDRWMGFARDDVRAWLHAAGLRDATVDSLDATCCAASDCGEQAAIGIFVAAAEKPHPA